MESPLKRLLGCTLLAAADALPSAKPLLRRGGLRTNKAWFGGRVVRAQARDGVRLALASVGENYLSFELFWRGLDYYEPLTVWLAGELAADAGHFLDVGANIGFYSLMLAARRPALGITAFEPNPKLQPLLVANVRANGFRQIVPEPLAVSSTEGTASLFLNDSDMSASLERDFDDHHIGTARIPTTSLDAYVARRHSPARLLIKVDVEGHEAAFIAGARATLRAHRPDIIAEVAKPYTPDTLALLAACHYRCYSISDDGLIRIPAPAPVVRPPLIFLNNLLTTRPQAEISRLSERLRAYARNLDLFATSKKADARVLEKFRSWTAPALLGTPRGKPASH